MICILPISPNAVTSMLPYKDPIGTSLAVVEPKNPFAIMLPKKAFSNCVHEKRAQ